MEFGASDRVSECAMGKHPSQRPSRVRLLPSRRPPIAQVVTWIGGGTKPITHFSHWCAFWRPNDSCSLCDSNRGLSEIRVGRQPLLLSFSGHLSPSTYPVTRWDRAPSGPTGPSSCSCSSCSCRLSSCSSSRRRSPQF